MAKVQVNMTMEPELVARLDTWAVNERRTRSALMEIIVGEALEARRRGQAGRTGGEAVGDMGAGGNATGANPEYPAYTTGGTADDRAA